MAKAQISFKYNNKTGKRDILIDYESDASSLTFEHEDDHRELVGKIIDHKQLARQQEVSVEREEEEQKLSVQPEQEEERRQKQVQVKKQRG